MRGIPFTATAIVCFLFASMSAGQDASVSAPPTASAQQAKPGQQPANPTQEIAREQPEGPALAVGSSADSHRRLSRGHGDLPLHQQRGRRRHQLRVDSVRGHGPGQCERNTAQCAVVTHIPSCGCRFPGAGDTFSPAVGLLRNGLQWDDAGHRGGHEHERWVSPPPGVRRGSVRPNVLPGCRSGLHADDGAERSAQHLAVGRRIVAGRRHQLPGRDDLGSDSPGASDVAPLDAHQLGGVAGESGAAARKGIGGTARVLRERYRRPIQHRGRRAQGAQLDDRIS